MRKGGEAADWKVRALDPEGVLVFTSPNPAAVHVSRPTLLALPGGRIVAAFDQHGPGVHGVTGAKGKLTHLNRWLQGKIYISNDRGQTWHLRHEFPFCNGCLFRDGATLYLIGRADAVQIIRSLDGGDTWSRPADLTPPAEAYSQIGANVLGVGPSLYLAMMQATTPQRRGEAAATLAPVLMKAAQGASLTVRRSWSFSNPGSSFAALVPHERLDFFGVPFFPVPDPDRGTDAGNKRWAHRIGWGDPHLLRIGDPNHYWHDPSGRTFHLLARAATHRANLAALAKVVETPDGSLRIELETTPAGTKAAFLPLPGGHMKFSVVYDEPSRLFWMAGNQATDSMTRAERLPPERYRLPCDEAHRLQLHFSRNLVDWCFAGFVTGGTTPRESHVAPSLAIRGNDLCLLCGAADAHSRHALETNEIRFHCVPDFRDLTY